MFFILSITLCVFLCASVSLWLGISVFHSADLEPAAAIGYNPFTPSPHSTRTNTMTETTPNPDDPLALTELFQGGGEPWLPLLKPTIEAQPAAATFIGPKRHKSVVPVRELTFQALKPNPPQKWKVIVFGQNPYPRVESATGIAMFDNSFKEWKEGRFGSVTSMRCIIKAAAIWKHGIDKKTPVAEIRQLLADNNVVPPPHSGSTTSSVHDPSGRTAGGPWGG